MTFDIRGVRMGGRLLMHAAAVESDRHVYTVDIRVDQFVTDSTDTWGGINRLDDLATLVAVQLANRLVPDATKPGYEHSTGEASTSGAAASTSSNPAPRSTNPTPRPLPGPRPTPPIHDPLRIGPIRMPRPQPTPFGQDDLLPPGLPGFGVGRMDGRGGNLMGPGFFAPPGGGRMPGVPPGARYDPVYPIPDNDMEAMPGFDDEHALRPPPRGGPGGTGNGEDEGPPQGMYF